MPVVVLSVPSAVLSFAKDGQAWSSLDTDVTSLFSYCYDPAVRSIANCQRQAIRRYTVQILYNGALFPVGYLTEMINEIMHGIMVACPTGTDAARLAARR